MEHDVIIISSDNQVGTPSDILGPLAKLLLNTAFKQRLATSMIAPIRRRLDYQGIARKALLIQPLPSWDDSK